METERRTDYKDINKVIMINILDYELFGFEEYISETKVVLDKHEVTYLTGDEAVKRMEFLHEKWEMDRISEINHAKEVGKIEEKIEGKIEEKKETAKKIFRARRRYRNCYKSNKLN